MVGKEEIPPDKQMIEPWKHKLRKNWRNLENIMDNDNELWSYKTIKTNNYLGKNEITHPSKIDRIESEDYSVISMIHHGFVSLNGKINRKQPVQIRFRQNGD